LATKNDFIVTPAIVLRRADYGDYDRMVTLFSPEYGKISAIARGVKRPKARLSSATEPLCVGEYQLHERSGRYAIEQCMIKDAYFPIRCDYDKLVHAAYWLKLAEAAVVEDVPNPELFHLLMTALEALVKNPLPLALTTFAFESHYMELAGMSPYMHECVLCGAEPTGRDGFSAFAGGLVCPRHPDGLPISEGARRILMKLPRTRFEQYVLLNDRPEWREAAGRLRAFVDYHIEAAIKQYPEIG